MIKFIIDEQEYALEWDRRTIMWTERQGFSIARVEEQIMTSAFMMFKGMLKKHHSSIAINDSLTESLFDKFVQEYDVAEFFEVAIEGYSAFLQTTQTDSPKKKLIRS